MPIPLIQEFSIENRSHIIKLLARLGKCRNVDCINLTRFSPITDDMPVYAFIGLNNIVIVLIDWSEKALEEVASEKCDGDEPPVYRSSEKSRISPVWILKEFTRQFLEGTENVDCEGQQVVCHSILLTNSTITNREQMEPVWDNKNVIVHDRFERERILYVHYNTRFYPFALKYYKSFWIWCEGQGYLNNTTNTFEGIDAKYDEMEFRLDKDDNDIDDPDYRALYYDPNNPEEILDYTDEEIEYYEDDEDY